MLSYEILHFLLAHVSGVYVLACVRGVLLYQLIRAEALLAALAVHERIGEAADVAGGDPCLRIHENGAVKTYVMSVFRYKLTPPCFLNVVFEFYTERTVIPCVCETAVYLRAGENVAAVFTKSYYFIHCLFVVVHVFLLRNV